MSSCPLAKQDKAVVNYVAEGLQHFDVGGTHLFAAWEVVNQFGGELSWDNEHDVYNITEYDSGVARQAASEWVAMHGECRTCAHRVDNLGDKVPEVVRGAPTTNLNKHASRRTLETGSKPHTTSVHTQTTHVSPAAPTPAAS